ncbi:MAG TPA: type I DNA topoisomerase [Candidatus Obscuribacterales bacterium]
MAAKSRATDGNQQADKLVIVESPAKAKTIEGYLGKEYKVVSCYGHVRDLPKNNSAIDIEHGFKPTYQINDDKKEVVRELKRLAKQSTLVYLASDDDREGEAISWHLKESLNLKDSEIRRIVFHEITKNAILNAINHPRKIDQNLVNAQQARRILDRLVGFELSPLLWKKIKAGLSAGRVQSVAVRMVVEREREIEQFATESYYRVVAHLKVDDKILKAELNNRFKSLDQARDFLKRCIDAEFSIASLQVKEGKRSPAAPFTTSTLQQEASRKLGYSVSKTMTLAQRLYEAGKISYMRTDSVNLSEEAIKSACQEIIKEFGKQYAHSRRYKTKSQSAQEAHEAIRPTDFSVPSTGGDSGERALYELIWKRAIASQMADARIEKTIAGITISGQPEKLTATGEVIRFDGFLKVYIEETDDEDREEARMLPPLSEGQVLPLEFMHARETFSKPPARFTEATLVKSLEEMGIGRPSTYAPTIATIQKREYVIRESREGKERSYNELILRQRRIQEAVKTETFASEKSKLFPTSLAKVVTDFLVEYFDNVVDYSFTAQVEKEFDDISRGHKAWDKMISDFYFHDFHPKVTKTQDVDRSEVGTVRELGIDPKSGRKVIARLGRFGPVVQIGESGDDGDKPRYAPLEKDQFLDTISLEQALELFKLPRAVGTYEGEELVIGKGPFGQYIRHQGKFVSLPKGENPMAVNEARAIELIEAKRKADAEKLIRSFDENPEVLILNGRWGPYIKAGSKNVKLPKGSDPLTIPFAEVQALADAAPEKKSFKRGGKAAKDSKTAVKTASKVTSKTSAKSKAGAKTAAKSTAKPGLKTAAKAVPKTAAKTSAKTAAKTVAKKASASKAAPKTTRAPRTVKKKAE